MGKTRFQKVEQRHLIGLDEGKKALAVGLHIIHEVTSSQAFAALKKMGIGVHRPQNTFAVTDHVVNTGGSSAPNDLMDEILIKTLEDNCEEHNITLYGQHNGLQGVCHVIAPEVVGMHRGGESNVTAGGPSAPRECRRHESNGV